MFLTSPEHYLHTSTRDKSLRTRYLQAAHNILGHRKVTIPKYYIENRLFFGRQPAKTLKIKGVRFTSFLCQIRMFFYFKKLNRFCGHSVKRQIMV